VAGAGRDGDALVEHGVAGRGHDQGHALELRFVELAGEPADRALTTGAGRADPAGEFGGDERSRHDFHAGARFEQQARLALGHLATAHQQHTLATQISKQGEVPQVAPYPSRPCSPHSRFRPKKRVASASPASASERVVCQSPIET
jgi:hypothetical protein